MELNQARNDLAVYAAVMWPPFACAPHHRLIIEELEAVERGDIDRLILTLPPRHGKSLLTSKIFPAWYLGRNPSRSIIIASYAQELASDFGRAVRDFVSDPLHTAIFPGPLTTIASMLRWVDVQGDYVRRLGLKVRVIGGHVALDAMGFKPGARPHPGHHHVANTQFCAQFAAAPVGRAVARPGRHGQARDRFDHCTSALQGGSVRLFNW